MKRPAVFFDRDGVLNEAILADGVPHSPRTLEDFRLTPGAGEALARLKSLGFALVVITNQPEVRRGSLRCETVEAMHRRLAAELPVDGIYVCYHDDADACNCRKPMPGLIHRAAVELDLELGASYFVGDRWRDVDAGANAGCKTVLIDRGYHEPPPLHRPDARVESLEAAVAWIIADHKRPR